MKKIRQVSVVILSFVLLLTSLTFSGCFKDDKKTSSYEIECTFEDNVLTGKEKVCFYNDTENSFTELKFNLFANAFRKDAKYSPVSAQHQSQCYPNGVSYGGMEIKGVTRNGEALEFSISGEDCNILTVSLNDEIFPDENVTVTIDFVTTLANVVHRTGYNDNTVNLANFYPVLCGIEDGAFYECVYYANGDPFFSECANYNVKFTANEKYTVAGAGSIVSKTQNGSMITYEYDLPFARSYTLVLSEKFEMLTDSSLGIDINYYYYEDDTPKDSLDYAVKSMSLFSETFGDYPYQTYSVVQTEFVQGGMEFSGLVMISDNLESKAYGEVIVHETAHQWWQTAVGNNEIKYGFLDEGLAEYSVVLFYEKYPEYGYTRSQLIKSSETTYKMYCSVYDKLFGETNTTMLRSLDQFTSEYEYVNIAYVKPCIMYDSLRTTLGDDKFFGALKKYYSEYSLEVATPYDLVGVFEKYGTDTNGFFESFFNGKVII